MEASSSHFKTYLRWYLLLVLIFIGFMIWSVVLDKEKIGVLKFVVLDIGQGDAIFIESPTGVQIIVDGGPNNNLLKQIPKVIPWYDRTVDMIVVTNPDADHYEGFIKFLDKYKVKKILEPGTTNTYRAYGVLQEKLKIKNVEKVLARKGQIIDIGGGAYLHVLFPDRDVLGLTPNDGSIVMKLVYGNTSVMLQGDSTAKIEQYLLSTASTTLDADILKAGHHGSRTSSYVGYVKTVSPKWTVISSGVNNSYGHPHKEVLDTMQKLEIPTFDTCNNGRLIFESDGKNFVLKNKNIKIATAGCKF